MNIEEFIEALIRTVELLKQSEDSAFTRYTCSEIILILEENINELKKNGSYQKMTLAQFYGPTAAIQEISIDNGWGDEYLHLASIVDYYTKN